MYIRIRYVHFVWHACGLFDDEFLCYEHLSLLSVGFESGPGPFWLRPPPLARSAGGPPKICGGASLSALLRGHQHPTNCMLGFPRLVLSRLVSMYILLVVVSAYWFDLFIIHGIDCSCSIWKCLHSELYQVRSYRQKATCGPVIGFLLPLM